MTIDNLIIEEVHEEIEAIEEEVMQIVFTMEKWDIMHLYVGRRRKRNVIFVSKTLNIYFHMKMQGYSFKN